MIHFGPPRTLAALLVSLVLASCGAAQNSFLQADSDPNPGVARAHAMPIQGIDISKYQGDIDWARVRNDDVAVRWTGTALERLA